MEYVYFIILKSCFIDPFIWSLTTNGFDIAEQCAINPVIITIHYQDLVYILPYQFLAFSLLFEFLPSHFETYSQLCQELGSQCWPVSPILLLPFEGVTVAGVGPHDVSSPRL